MLSSYPSTIEAPGQHLVTESIYIEPPTSRTQVLLIHAPYPAEPMFEADPSSLLYAIGPYARHLHRAGRVGELGLLDPKRASEGFYGDLERLLGSCTELRAVCISTSSAAIEETARIASLIRSVCGARVLVVAGGPHEDDVDQKCAERLQGVDLSIAGDAEYPLELALRMSEEGTLMPNELAQMVAKGVASGAHRFGVGQVTARHGEGVLSVPFAGERIPLDHWVDRPRVRSLPVFDVFERPTLTLMVSRGCSYGRCTFCAEASLGLYEAAKRTDWIERLAKQHPEAALYFQDSIFPLQSKVLDPLLELLRALGRPWGAQIYLPTVSSRYLAKLREAGCNYLYTGLEAANEQDRRMLGKGHLDDGPMLERLLEAGSMGFTLGLSVIREPFTAESLARGRDGSISREQFEHPVVQSLRAQDLGGSMKVYQSLLTVLPGTPLSKELQDSGLDLDFYRMPRHSSAHELEDGPIGYNLHTLLTTSPHSIARSRAVSAIVEDSKL